MTSQKSKNKEAARSIAVAWTDNAWEDYLFWQKENPAILAKINTLIDACRREPFKGLGKPEPLKGSLTGFWSRRIDREHRLVYLFEADSLYILQCRYHYG